MDARRVLYVGALGEPTDSRIMSLRAAGMEVDAVTACDAALTRAAEMRSQIIVVDMSQEASQARKIARAFGDDKAMRELPVVLIGVSPNEMTVTRSKVPRARAMFVTGASAGEVAAVVSRVPIPPPKARKAAKAKRRAASPKSGAARTSKSRGKRAKNPARG